MPITVDERDALRQLVDFAKAELSNAGDPTNNLNNLQALTEQRMAEYQASIDIDTAAVQSLIEASPAAHAFWEAAQESVWVRLNATLSAQDLDTLGATNDPAVARLYKTLPLLASLRWTLTNFQDG